MAPRIDGPLYYERMGRRGPVVVFVHPNPMDQSCWMFQMAHLSTWYRCIAIDLPGYGRSPRAEDGLTLDDVALACWEVLDEVAPGESTVLVGCSVGSDVVTRMRFMRPERSAALVVTGGGYLEDRSVVEGRIKSYLDQGVDFRWQYVFEVFSPAFRPTTLAHYFAGLFTERNDTADVQTIVRLFRALAEPYPEGIYDINGPLLIIAGTEDPQMSAALALHARVPDSELRVVPGAGHVCHLEQPGLFDRYLLAFLNQRLSGDWANSAR